MFMYYMCIIEYYRWTEAVAEVLAADPSNRWLRLRNCPVPCHRPAAIKIRNTRDEFYRLLLRFPDRPEVPLYPSYPGSWETGN